MEPVRIGLGTRVKSLMAHVWAHLTRPKLVETVILPTSDNPLPEGLLVCKVNISDADYQRIKQQWSTKYGTDFSR